MMSIHRIQWNPVFVFLFFLPVFLCANSVKINEFLYDPVGSDGGNEWIELYNDSDEEVNLTGWKLQKQGASLYNVLTFSDAIMPPHSFLLIGEENVENADIVSNLAFYNGTNTVVVRLVSADEYYTDTVLYSEPNDNNLIDDNGNIATSFAPDVYNGNVLMRYPDGADTDDCGIDFFESSLLTPGEPNIVPIDLEISNACFEEQNGNLTLFTTIWNLSTIDVDNSAGSLDIYLNNNLIETQILPEIAALDSINISHQFEPISFPYIVVRIELNYNNDNNIDNNEYSLSYLFNSSFLILNEILFKPDETNQPWVEIFCRNDVDNLVDNFFIEDAAGNKTNFTKTLGPENYYVVCRYPDEFMNFYAIEDSTNIIESSGWAYLNTTTETLWLKDDYGTVLDILSYNGSGYDYNVSIERTNPYSDTDFEWKMSEAETGSTPLSPNSVMPFPTDLGLEFDTIWEESGTIFHQLKVRNYGFSQINQCAVQLYEILNDEISESFIIEEQFTFTDTLFIQFQTAFRPNDFVTYRYELYAVDDYNSQNNETFGFYPGNKMPAVINEIMYNPFDEEPEWIEIKTNFIVQHAPHFILKMDDLEIPFTQNYDYVIITNNQENADELSINYDLLSEQVFIGLGTLTNSGKNLSITDMNGIVIESFFYLPEWNNDIKGVSMERINPTICSSEANWGPCLETSTPGRKNSLFIETMPMQAKLTIHPNPFSPYRNEVSILSYQLPEAISSATIRIFDLKGREIRKLINQDLVASEGSIIWDGKDNRQKNAPIGIYIIKMEATARFTQKVYTQSKTIVVGK